MRTNLIAIAFVAFSVVAFIRWSDADTGTAEESKHSVTEIVGNLQYDYDRALQNSTDNPSPDNPSPDNSNSIPVASPSILPSSATKEPTSSPTTVPPTFEPSLSLSPTDPPTITSVPTLLPTKKGTTSPSGIPTITSVPTLTPKPSSHPSSGPSKVPSASPTSLPSPHPSSRPSKVPSTSPTVTLSMRPSTSRSPTETPTTMPSLSPSVTQSPSNPPTLSIRPSTLPTTSPSQVPSNQPSNSPSLAPTSLPSIQPTTSIHPSISPSNIASYAPSGFPTYGIKNVTTSMLEMNLVGLGGKLEGTEATEHWRTKTSEFIKQYWDREDSNMNMNASEFPFTDVVTYIERQYFIPNEKRRANSVRRALNTDASQLKIVFTQEYNVRGTSDIVVPETIYFTPLQDPNYIPFLKTNDDESENQIFKDVTETSIRTFTTEAPSASSSPSQSPSVSPQSPPALSESLNEDGGDMDQNIQIVLISLGSVSCIVIFLYLTTRVGRKRATGEEGENLMDPNAGAVDATRAMEAANRTSAKVVSDIEIEQVVPSFSFEEQLLDENSLSFAESSHRSAVAANDEKIDLSVYTNDPDPSNHDQQFSIQGDSEFEDSDSMLSFDVYSSTDDENSGNTSSINELIVVPKGTPKSEAMAKIKSPSKQENLVVTGAPLSPSKMDGPTIGTTTVIEGTGALEGIQMMTVGDIDDMEVSTP